MKRTSSDPAPSFLGLDPQALLTRALARGGLYADVFAEDSERAFVLLEGGSLRRAGRDHDRGFAVRLLDRLRATRLVSSTALDPSSALGLAGDLSAGLIGGAGAPLSPVAFLQRANPVLFAPRDLSMDRRVELCWIAERAARAAGPKVREVSVSLRDVVRKTAIAGSDGRLVAAEQTRVVLAVEAIAEDGGLTQSAFEASGGSGGYELVDETVAERTGRLAGERAQRMLRALPAPAGAMAVVLGAQAGGTFVHEAVGHALEADAVLEEMSVFAGALGETVASALITVLDDPTLPDKNGSMLFDDEGSPPERTVLVERGVLKSYLHDLRTAERMGAHSNGHGRRESFRARPIVRMGNTMIAPGPHPPEDILRDTDRGLYVARMGGGEVDTVTGQFLFEVSEAYRIEGGALGEPVRGATLAGDLREVLLAIDRLGSDLGFGIGTCGKEGQDVPVADAEPTLRVPELVVGGA